MILQKKSDLIEIGNVFDHLNIVYKKHLNNHVMNNSPLSNDYMILAESLRCKVVIEQVDIYKHVFVKLVDQLENTKSTFYILFIFSCYNKSTISHQSMAVLRVTFNYL